MIRLLFPTTLFLGAFLLFSIQPMVAKTLLPVYGGTPMVWTVCMLFFQCILLGAYGYVNLFPYIRKATLWPFLHFILVGISFFAIPLIFQPESLSSQPEKNILYNLIMQLGLPLLVLGASSPLLQLLYTRTPTAKASDPYFLYGASNLGSLLALISYPWLMEQFIGLHQQFYLWSMVYCIYCFLLFCSFFSYRYQSSNNPFSYEKKPSYRSIILWIGISFLPCSLMLGVTLYITTDIAVTPLFWILPLVLYLLSFILTFTNNPLFTLSWINRNALLFLMILFLSFIVGINQIRAWQFIIIHLTGFFVITLLCHKKLYQLRPPAQWLTLFYFCLALGGVLAGLVNGLIAPHWFNQIYEYPLVLLCSLLIIPNIKTTSNWWISPLVFFFMIISHWLPIGQWRSFSYFQLYILVILGFTIIRFKNRTDLFLSLGLILCFTLYVPHNDNDILEQKRNFYGIKRVIAKESLHVLISQSTAHGLQNRKDNSLDGASSYYGAITQSIHTLQNKASALQVTLVGLGTGTSLCQFRTQDIVNIIEIDSQVIALAENPNLFSYLRDCAPQKHLINDDGRMALSQFSSHSQDLIILDAFSSDAIPTHLITLEAFEKYKEKLIYDGVILIHLSNRHLDLLPVISTIGRSLDMMVFHINYPGNPAALQFFSQWALLTTNKSLIMPLNKAGWRFSMTHHDRLWTDDYSNIIPLLRWQ